MAGRRSAGRLGAFRATATPPACRLGGAAAASDWGTRPRRRWHAGGMRGTDEALEDAIRDLLARRSEGATICPSEAARAVAGEGDWRALMEPPGRRPAGSSTRVRRRSPRAATWSTLRRRPVRCGSGGPAANIAIWRCQRSPTMSSRSTRPPVCSTASATRPGSGSCATSPSASTGSSTSPPISGSPSPPCRSTWRACAAAASWSRGPWVGVGVLAAPPRGTHRAVRGGGAAARPHGERVALCPTYGVEALHRNEP